MELDYRRHQPHGQSFKLYGCKNVNEESKEMGVILEAFKASEAKVWAERSVMMRKLLFASRSEVLQREI